MPIYEYECPACGKTSEFIEGRASEATGRVCRHCREIVRHRVLPKGMTARMNGMMGGRGGKTCCGMVERCGKPPCDEPGGCCR